jgi:hypothetical protein
LFCFDVQAAVLFKAPRFSWLAWGVFGQSMNAP